MDTLMMFAGTMNLTTDSDILDSPVVRVALGVAVLMVLIAFAFWLLARFRDYSDDNRPDPEELMENLREMLRRGEISEKEYRTIQASTRRSVAQETEQQNPDRTQSAND